MYEERQVRGFNKQHPKYMCFCNRVHVKTLTWIICILLAISVGLQLGALIATIIRGDYIVPDLIGVIVESFFLLCLYIALRREHATLLIVSIVVKIVGAVLVGLLSILLFVLLFFSVEDLCKTQEDMEKVEQCQQILGKKGTYFAAAFLCFLLYIFATVVEVRCYRYFKDKARYEVATYDTEKH